MTTLAKAPAGASVLIAALKLSQGRETISLSEVASTARCTTSVARRALSNLKLTIEDDYVSLKRSSRFQLALQASRFADLQEVARTLTWQEFERYAEECLYEAGYSTERNVRVKASDRTWEIDIVGSRIQTLLCLDCKHWAQPNYASKFKHAIRHQKTATNLFLAGKSGSQRLWALPILLTLYNPPASIAEGVVLLPIQKLLSFLQEVSPYDQNLPFVCSEDRVVENPIKGSHSGSLNP